MEKHRDNRIASVDTLDAAKPVLRHRLTSGWGERRSGVRIAELAVKGASVPGAPKIGPRDVRGSKNTHSRRLPFPPGRKDQHIPIIDDLNNIGGVKEPAMTSLTDILLKRRRGNDLRRI